MAKEKKHEHKEGCACEHHSHEKSDEQKAKDLQQRYIEYQMFEQQMKAMQEQMEKFDQQIIEICSIAEQLEDLKKTKVNSDILVPIANGIFVKGKLLDNKDVLVNVGAGVTVKKTVDDTAKLLKSQAEEIEKYKLQVAAQIEMMRRKGQQLEEELEGMIK
ncbi:MAG: prefoldin subunit alpha [Nanoarchaeota archaeon]|nr:prefoldin subunit alpha [Nanoarchaeota archaeon]